MNFHILNYVYNNIIQLAPHCLFFENLCNFGSIFENECNLLSRSHINKYHIDTKLEIMRMYETSEIQATTALVLSSRNRIHINLNYVYCFSVTVTLWKIS